MKRFLAVMTLLSMGLWIAGCEPTESTKPDAGKGTPAMEGNKGGPPPGAGGLDPSKAAEGKKSDEAPADDEKKTDEAPADDEKKTDEAPADDEKKTDE